MNNTPNPLLHIENLALSIGKTEILRDIDIKIERGKIMGIVGESGSGKSMTAMSIMGLLPYGAKANGKISFNGQDILNCNESTMCSLRGDDIGMVFQEPMTALNPVQTIGDQVAEGIRLHTKVSKNEAFERARDILQRVGLPQSQFPLSRYPHQLSGGQRQRVVIAIACALKPKLLIADEPTTALDVVLQKQILELLRELVEENDMAMALISHDLAVVCDMADDITVMRHGEIMERGETARVLVEQSHPYTRQLAKASTHIPARARQQGDTPSTTAPLLKLSNVTRDYAGAKKGLFQKRETFRAVNDVSFEMKAGQSIALVGRSGCGKSTLARMILALDKPTSGNIFLNGENLTNKTPKQLKPLRQNMQVVFQDPYGSFNPRHKVERLVSEPLHLLDTPLNPTDTRERVALALQNVGLEADAMDKFAHEFSGGQRQRISIARALIIEPKLIIADEPVSALDVSIRAQVLDLFAELNERFNLAYLFITHDLTVARAITDDVMVMHGGAIVEAGKTSHVLDNPQSAAAKALVDAAPDLDRAIKMRLAKINAR